MPASVSVVIACYSEDRWDQLSDTIESLANQTTPADEVIVVVDHNDPLRARIAATWPRITTLANAGVRGASGARNTGVRHAGTELVAFLDDDTAAWPCWLEQLIAPFADEDIVGVGGAVEPRWESSEPSWFPPEFHWVVGASYRGMPAGPAMVRNVWSENMAVRRDDFLAAGGFREGFGKVADRSRPEDTDLCLRMAGPAHSGETGWRYVPAALVSHHVPADRATLRFFLGRCYAEGIGKAQLRLLHRHRHALTTERQYLRGVVFRAVLSGLRRPLGEGAVTRLAQAAMVVAGVGAAGCGFAHGNVVRKGA